MLRRALTPGADGVAEAAVMEHARAHGVPIPMVHRASGPEIVMDRVDGPSMLEDLLRHPDRASAHGRILADLHGRLDGVPQPSPASGSARLLHLDLHPGNVILSGAGPVLIDWTNALYGDRALDVATTWLILECFGIDEDQPTAAALVRRSLTDAFLERVDLRSTNDALPAAAAARSSDPATTDDERARIAAMVDGAV